MGVQTAISAVQSLLKLLQSQRLREILSIFGRESQLDDFKTTVNKIKNVFRQVDDGPVLYSEPRDWLEKIKNAVFEAHNELENLVFLANQTQLYRARAYGNLSKKVCNYCYRFNHFGVPYRVAQGVHKILRKLDSAVIGYNEVELQPIRRRRDETCAAVNESYIIGRESDVEKIVGMLLDSNTKKRDHRDVSFLSIVGIAGLGKTVLAQLVFNDDRIMNAFSLRLWISVSNHGSMGLDLKEILTKIISSDTVMNRDYSRDELERLVERKVAGKKYLIILDDVWFKEVSSEIIYDVKTSKITYVEELANCLNEGEKGSWIVVTTSSRKVARTIQDGQVYELQGLLKRNSWQLFQKMAFYSEESNSTQDFVEIGKGIVDGCAGNPLAIKAVGNLLYGQDITKWQTLREVGVSGVMNGKNAFMSILKGSYDYLDYVKTCLTYCALFPKDFTINKDMLISLWMAQGYINSSIDGLDAGEECFSTLVDRYFFKDIQREKSGEILSCKIHDLIHYLAQHIAGEEMCIISDFQNGLDEGVRHVSVLGGQFIGDDFSGNTNILSYLHVGYNDIHFCNVTKSSLESLLAKCTNLKALDLSGLFFISLPDSIGELRLLRYLNLSGNRKIKELPRTITNLQNLQTLNLQECCKFKEWPQNFTRLVSLRLLNIRSCSSLTCMPKDIGKLTRLQKLSDFMVGVKGSFSSWKKLFDGLENLNPLGNLQGHLNIAIRCPIAKEDAWREGLYPLLGKILLEAIEYNFKNEEVNERLDIEEVTRLMKELQPPWNLEYIKVWRYHGARMDWLAFPVKLVELEMVQCWELECFPCLGDLRYLKVLKLVGLKKLEHIIGEDVLSAKSSAMPMGSEGFSRNYNSLETLRLENLPKFKGWQRKSRDEHLHQACNDGSSSSDNELQWQMLPRFSKLNLLLIWNCPKLTCIPPCPTVEELKWMNFNRRLRIIKSIHRGENSRDVASSSASCSGSYIQTGIPELKKVVLSDIVWLKSLPNEAFQCLENLEIWCDKELESLGEVEEVFRSCSSSLKTLIIHQCSNLRRIVSGIKHLTALNKLEIRSGSNLTLVEEEEDEEIDSIGIGIVPWSSNLQTLTLEDLPELINLPSWMEFLPALENLGILSCCQLKSMPNWMTRLTSLRNLDVISCSAILEKRCKNDPLGEDWAYIQHIPNVKFQNCFF